MLTLQTYLDGDYQIDREDIRTLEAGLKRTGQTFIKAFRGWSLLDGPGGYWDYEQRAPRADSASGDSAEKKLENLSQGTLAMVLAAAGKLNGYCTLHDEKKARLGSGYDGLGDCWQKGTRTLAAIIGKREEIYSSSFGKNDPVTLSHITELLRGVGAGEHLKGDAAAAAATLTQVTAFIKENGGNVLSDLRGLCGKDPGRTPMLPHLGTLGGKKDYLRNAFVPVRVVRNAHWLKRQEIDIQEIKDFQLFFEGVIHDHLSYSSILDSRFDAAELMFGLEGLLLCHEEAVDSRLFERILNVLEQKQKESAHWRPSRPIYATSRGMTMLPISVEGANSLLRSFAIVEKKKEFGYHAGKCVSIIRRFWHWLRARVVEFEDYFGWHSEHVNEPDLIHIWDTSQVVEFMLEYRSLLQHHIARQTLALSRVKVDDPISLKDELASDTEVGWADVVSEREPVRSLGKQYKVYERIGEDFVAPWLKGNPSNHSMLLYGPPGTGKTLLARLLAGALGFPLISISVSDFLGSGDGAVEARAKAIFQMLEAQADCVILFDEIDSFLLDRDSNHYREQDTVFQFLTPGMLTKIHDLRDAARSLFIIATNYESRIDPAIKRAGRVDRKYLLLTPDADQRITIMKKRKDDIQDCELGALKKASLFLGFAEISSAIEKNKTSNRTLTEELHNTERSTGGEFYGRRFYIDNPFPMEEAGCLFCLAEQVATNPGPGKKNFQQHFDDGVGQAAIGQENRSPEKDMKVMFPLIVARGTEILELMKADGNEPGN